MRLLLFSSKQCIIKQLLDSVFVISGIIKVSVSVISLSLRLRLITLIPRPWLFLISQKPHPITVYNCSASFLNYDVHMATDHDSKICAKKILKTKSLVKRALCIGQIEASISPPGIPRAFDTLVVPVRREFDNQSLHGGGEFWPMHRAMGYLNWTLHLISFWWFPLLVKAICILWKNNLKKKKTDPFIYRFHKNGLYALGRSTTPHWEVAWNDERRQWT